MIKVIKPVGFSSTSVGFQFFSHFGRVFRASRSPDIPLFKQPAHPQRQSRRTAGWVNARPAVMGVLAMRRAELPLLVSRPK